jgi:predicted lipoprotein
MSRRAVAPARRRAFTRWVLPALAVVLVAAMALDTKVVKIGAEQSTEFSPESYGEKAFPEIQAAVEKKAVDAAELAKAIQDDQQGASDKYGVQGLMGPEMPVRFTGVAGKGEDGIYTVKVPGVPDGVTIRVQTGPAINGTDLRDATGTIRFEQFKNQIQYQNAGSGINEAMKKQVLSRIDTAHLEGKTIRVTGVFLLLTPDTWMVTPVKLDVGP